MGDYARQEKATLIKCMQSIHRVERSTNLNKAKHAIAQTGLISRSQTITQLNPDPNSHSYLAGTAIDFSSYKNTL